MELIKSDYQLLSTEPQKLKDITCSFVLLTASHVLQSNGDPLIAPDAFGGYKTLNKETLWGLDGVCVHQLFLTESTILIPVSNANQITVRCKNPSNGQIIAFSCFK